jgi:hypothetical protein
MAKQTDEDLQKHISQKINDDPLIENHCDCVAREKLGLPASGEIPDLDDNPDYWDAYTVELQRVVRNTADAQKHEIGFGA